VNDYDELTPEEIHMPALDCNLWNEREAERSRKAPHRVLMVDGVWMTSMPLSPPVEDRMAA
jgi:hypothetical protein